MRQNLYLFVIYFILGTSYGVPQMEESEECKKLSQQCENDTDCIHRLAVVQSACVTNTCQPQCRQAAMNLYQNRQGRNLLRSDASCVPGKSELEQCGFLPNKSPKHCSFAKLICEADLQCNSKWEVFISECEAETSIGQCSEKCRRHLNATLATPQGAEYASCTCTDKDDQLCIKLKDSVLKSCIQQPSTNEVPPEATTPSGSRITSPRGRATITPGEPGSAATASFSIVAVIIGFAITQNLAGIY